MTLKIYNISVLLIILFSSYHVSAQIPLTSTGAHAGNFTSFTTEKTYDDMALLKAITSPVYYNNPDFGIRVNNRLDWYEQIDKRTLKSRTYKGQGNQIITENGYSNLNYTDANGWLRAVNTKLKPCKNGWCAEQQEIPVYIYHDGSTALSIGENDLMLFNKNVQFNGNGISTTSYTIGDNGMYITNTAANTDKIIRVDRGRIETDYKINEPINLNSDLVIGEDVVLPAGYTISENENYNPDIELPGSLIVKENDGKVVAELKSPFCYDNKGNSIAGEYQIQKQDGGYRLQVVVSSAWLNDPLRQYPVTIDPVVTGQLVSWGGGIIGSCLNTFGSNDTGTLQAIVPAAVTIDSVFIQSTFYSPIVGVDEGQMFFWTPCGDTISSDTSGTGSQTGYAHIAPPYDFLLIDQTYAGCILPSCLIQYLPITMGLLRYAGGSGCNADYIYYDPNNNMGYPFAAYVVGSTVEDSWSVPTSICGGLCTLTLTANVNSGVPPYTISHPWATGSTNFGGYSTHTAASYGQTNITLTIPNCDTFTVATNITVNPPTIRDACGDTVSGLIPIMVSISQPVEKPTISQNGFVLTSSASQGNQWVRNDTLIQGATNQTYQFSVFGWYQVIAQNPANGCSSASDSLDVTSGINQLSLNNDNITIYPNPANNLATVEFMAAEQNVQLALINVLGQILYSEILTPINGNNYRANLNLLQLPVGVYEVVIRTPSENVAKEIIKQE